MPLLGTARRLWSHPGSCEAILGRGLSRGAVWAGGRLEVGTWHLQPLLASWPVGGPSGLTHRELRAESRAEQGPAAVEPWGHPCAVTKRAGGQRGGWTRSRIPACDLLGKASLGHGVSAVGARAWPWRLLPSRR